MDGPAKQHWPHSAAAAMDGPAKQHWPHSPADGIGPSLLIIAGIIAFVFAASASIHFLLRFLSRHRRSSSSSPLVLLHHISSYSSSSSTSPSHSTRRHYDPQNNHHENAVIDSLPLFTLASSLAALPKSSPDCAVCLSRFHPHDQLRLLPLCRHAFHSSCIDIWLRSNLSCPLCRSPITPPDPPPPPAAAPDGSFRLEIGSVSRRRTSDGDHRSTPQPDLTHLRSYSLGSTFEYVVEEEIEAVVAALSAHVRRGSEPGEKDAAGSGAPAAPGGEVAEAAGGAGRSWLKDFVDRLATSASSSFSSMRFSGRWSRQMDGSGGGGGASWDLEASQHQHHRPEEEESFGGYYSFYRWLTGV